jgi:hypothetical protein
MAPTSVGVGDAGADTSAMVGNARKQNHQHGLARCTIRPSERRDICKVQADRALIRRQGAFEHRCPRLHLFQFFCGYGNPFRWFHCHRFAVRAEFLVFAHATSMRARTVSGQTVSGLIRGGPVLRPTRREPRSCSAECTRSAFRSLWPIELLVPLIIVAIEG